MPSGTVYAPIRVGDFEATKLQYNPMGVRGTISLNSTSNVDLYFTDDCMLTGMWVITSNTTLGDYIRIQVIDTDNIMGYGAGVMIKQFGGNVYLPPITDQQFDIIYPAKVLAGMSLRIAYTSTSIVLTPDFIVNYKLHKVLV
jgi:hypothetical protein